MIDSLNERIRHRSNIDVFIHRFLQKAQFDNGPLEHPSVIRSVLPKLVEDAKYLDM